MFLDPVLVQLPDHVEKEKYVVATYYVATGRNASALKYAAALAVEQSTGTWLRMPEETDAVREQFIGRVLGVYEVPAYQIEIPKEVTERQFIVRIGFPARNFGPQFAMLLTTVIGNISSGGKVKLLDLEFPEWFLKEFKGPKFGIQGIRDLLGVYDRPLLNNMIKPCTGIDAATTAKLAYQAAVGGVDIVKDDELVADSYHCPLVDRVKAVMEALKRADAEKGEKTLYAFNITDRVDKLRDNALRAIDAGANALMLNFLTVGLDACRMIAEDPAINVPLLAHPDFTGAVYESPWSGMSAALIGAKLPRMAGLDMMIVLSPYGKFPMMEDTFVGAGYVLSAPLKHIKPSFAMPGGGTTQGHVQMLIEKFGKDVIVAAGGAIHGHPMGSTAGAKAFRQAIDIVMQGKSLESAKGQFKELDAALNAWGIWKTDNEGIFDLKG
jgi:2,3-diketo-5-methylthiopentyl-1-phosphate enolase